MYSQFHYHVCNNLPSVPTLVHAFPSQFFKIYFNITFPSTPRSSKQFLFFRSAHQNPVDISLFPVCAYCPAHLILLYLTTITYPNCSCFYDTMEVITHHNIKFHMINHFTFLSLCRTWRTWDKHHSQLILWLSALKLLLTFNIQDQVKTQNSHIMPLHVRISNHLHYKYLKQNNVIKIPTRRAWVSKKQYQSNRLLLTYFSITLLTTNINQLDLIG